MGEIFTVDLTLCSQIDGEDFVNFCGLLRTHELYHYKCLQTNYLKWDKCAPVKAVKP